MITSLLGLAPAALSVLTALIGLIASHNHAHKRQMWLDAGRMRAVDSQQVATITALEAGLGAERAALSGGLRSPDADERPV